MRLIRLALYLGVVSLLCINLMLIAWHDGYEIGYQAAMADVVLQIESPFNFFY